MITTALLEAADDGHLEADLGGSQGPGDLIVSYIN